MFYSSNLKKFSTHKKTIFYIYSRLKNFVQGIPSVMSPIVNGMSDHDIDLIASRVENYIDISFQDDGIIQCYYLLIYEAINYNNCKSGKIKYC